MSGNYDMQFFTQPTKGPSCISPPCISKTKPLLVRLLWIFKHCDQTISKQPTKGPSCISPPCISKKKTLLVRLLWIFKHCNQIISNGLLTMY
jgi:hypothetical protein